MNQMVVRGSGGNEPYSRYPQIAPNTLRSKALLRTMHLISVGPIYGLIDGPKSIYFNDVPLIGPNGKANFEGVVAEFRDGSFGQSPIPGFPAVETTFAVGVQVLQNGGPVIRSYDTTNVDRIRIIIDIPALVRSVVETGDQMFAEVQYTVDWRPAGTTNWTALFHDRVYGKCVSPYLRATTVDCPFQGDIELRMTRITADSNDSLLINAHGWTSTVLIVDSKLEYPGSAICAISIDAQKFGSQLPEVTFQVGGILCTVPANYNPETREYATSGPGTTGGIWDGTFKQAVTNNPAWVWYTVATNRDWGCGDEIDAGAIDIWSLYAIAQYCDEPVDDGSAALQAWANSQLVATGSRRTSGGQIWQALTSGTTGNTAPTGTVDMSDGNIQWKWISASGTTEPRYTFNAVIGSRDDAYRVLQAIAQAFRGMCYWGTGTVIPVSDRPTTPSKLVTMANVIDGEITYEGSALRARHSVVKVHWRDPNNHFREAVEVIEDGELIQEIGVRDTDVEAIGCTTRGLARRIGRWILYTEKYETNVARYRASLDHIDIMPGEVILIQDPSIAGESLSGRLLAPATTTTAKLDRKVTLTAGKQYKFRVHLRDGMLTDEIDVTNVPFSGSEEVDTLSLDAGDWKVGGVAVDTAVFPPAGYIWMLITTDLKPLAYRVIQVVEENDGSFSVTAIRHYTDKYAAVETGIAVDDDDWTIYEDLSRPLAAPTNVTAVEWIGGVGTSAQLKVAVGWTHSTDARTRGYEIIAELDGVTVATAATADVSYEFVGLSPGTYIFKVRAVGVGNIFSAYAESNSVDIDGLPDLPPVPTGLTTQGVVRGIQVRWTNPTSARHLNRVEVWSSGSTTFNAGSLVGSSPSGSFVHTGLEPNSVHYYWIRSVDNFGQASSWVGPASGQVSILLTNDIADSIINTSKIAQGLALVEMRADLPQLGNWPGRVVLLTADYEYLGTTYHADTLWRWLDLNGDSTFEWTATLHGQHLADGSIIFGKIAAGAIRTNELAAEAIKAHHLAAEEIISSHVQLGTAVVQEAHIEDLVVSTIKVKSGAITAVQHARAFPAAGVGSSYPGTFRSDISAYATSLVQLYITIPEDSDGKMVVITKVNPSYFTWDAGPPNTE